MGIGDRKIKISGTRVFGSTTKGTFTDNSDLDLVVISEQANEIRTDTRLNEIIDNIKE